MFKIINSKEYAKLKRERDYWGTIALEEDKRKKLYQNLYESQKSKVFKLITENSSLDRKLEELEKGINNEHNCNRNCFKEHVLPAIQCDLNNFRYEKDSEEFDFLCYWDKKIKKEYDFVKYLHIYKGLIGVTFYSI